MASTAPSKSQSLLSFALPRLKWNNHPRGGHSNIAAAGTPSPPPPPQKSQSPFRQSATQNSPLHSGGGGGGDGGIEAEGSGKGKLEAECKRHVKKRSETHDRKVEKKSEKMKVVEQDHGVSMSSVDDKGNEKEPRSRILIKIPASMRNSGSNKVKEEENEVMIDEQKAWNLRPRRPVKKKLNVDDSGRGGVVLKAQGGGSVQEKKKKDQLQQESLENGARVRVEKEKKVKFSLCLTRQEIEEDVYSLTGLKASRRPKKRTRVVQKHLDNVFPGQWLGSITPDSYKVSNTL